MIELLEESRSNGNEGTHIHNGSTPDGGCITSDPMLLSTWKETKSCVDIIVNLWKSEIVRKTRLYTRYRRRRAALSVRGYIVEL